jgi:alpha-galactosidase/6-phospho-beta-glucosidase family protein
VNEGKRFVVAIAGGASRYTPGILKMLVAEKDRFPLSKVVLYDCEDVRQKRMGTYARVLMSEYYPECEVVDTLDPEEAFTGIDFCFMQIRAGRQEMRRSDEHIALKHGALVRRPVVLWLCLWHAFHPCSCQHHQRR